MDFYLILEIVMIILYFCPIISIPFKIKKYGTVLAGMGQHLIWEIISKMKQKNVRFWIREILIYLFALGIIILCYFIRYDVFPSICLCGCGVGGSYIATQELFPKKEEE